MVKQYYVLKCRYHKKTYMGLPCCISRRDFNHVTIFAICDRVFFNLPRIIRILSMSKGLALKQF